jgi:hypothetical protein
VRIRRVPQAQTPRAKNKAKSTGRPSENNPIACLLQAADTDRTRVGLVPERRPVRDFGMLYIGLHHHKAEPPSMQECELYRL